MLPYQKAFFIQQSNVHSQYNRLGIRLVSDLQSSGKQLIAKGTINGPYFNIVTYFFENQVTISVNEASDISWLFSVPNLTY